MYRGKEKYVQALVGEIWKKQTIGKPKRRCEVNIKMDTK
jgi:hypothetical protein